MRFFFVLFILSIASVSPAQEQEILEQTSDPSSFNGILYEALYDYAQTDSAKPALDSGVLVVEDWDITVTNGGNQIRCQKDRAGIYHVILSLKRKSVGWRKDPVYMQRILYEALKMVVRPQRGVISLQGPSVLLKVRMQNFNGEPAYCFDFLKPSLDDASLQATLEKFDALFESRGMKTTWFTEDLAIGFDQDILKRTGNVRAEVLVRYIRYRLSLEGLEKDLDVDQNSLAFQTLLAEMQKGRFSVLEKLPTLTRVFVKEGFRQIKKR